MIGEDSHLFWSKSLYWGLEIGADIVVYCVLAQWLWDRPYGVTSFVPYLIMSVCIYLCLRELVVLSPQIPFSELLLAGICAGVSSSLIVDLYSIIYVKIYDPAFAEQMVQQTASMASQLGYVEGDATDQMRQVFVPVLMVTNTIVYGIVASVLSAFGAMLICIRRKKDQNTQQK